MASVSTQRRQFLKAVGAAAAAMPFYTLLESSAVQGQAATRPLRLLLLYTGFGGVWQFIRPSAASMKARDVPITPDLLTFPNSVLEPLKAFSDKMLVLEGLAMTTGLLPLDDKDPINTRTVLIGHDHTAGNVFTGSPVKTVNKDDALPTGPSLEYVLGQKLGASTAVRSLQLGIGCASGVSFYDSLSFNETGQRLPGITDPKASYKQLFANFVPSGPPMPVDMTAQQKLKRDQSVVAAVHATASRLQSRLAGPERAKLDEHIAALADIEARLGGMGGGPPPVSCGMPMAPAGSTAIDGSAIPDATKLHFDVLTQAFACDRTRFAVAGWGINAGQMPWIFGKDVEDMHNDVAHAVNDEGAGGAAARLKISKLQNWYAARIAELMTRFQGISDGDGTLLDNTLIVWAQDFGQDVHGGLNVPYVLLGGAQKKFRMGRYLTLNLPDVPTGPDYVLYTANNLLLVSIMQAFGVPGDTFGSTEFKGPLPGLV